MDEDSNLNPITISDNHVETCNELEMPTQSKRKILMSLYEKCKVNFSTYLIEHKNSIRLLVQNSTLKNIRASDYINEQKEKNANDFFGLTPLPYKSMRKIKSEKEKQELTKLERNAVVMRMIEYTQKMNNNKIKQKYFHFVNEIILIQKCVRGFFVRKTINDIDKLNNQIEKFILHIMVFSIKKRKIENQEEVRSLNETIKTDKNSKIQKNDKNPKNSGNNSKISTVKQAEGSNKRLINKDKNLEISKNTISNVSNNQTLKSKDKEIQPKQNIETKSTKPITNKKKQNTSTKKGKTNQSKSKKENSNNKNQIAFTTSGFEIGNRTTKESKLIQVADNEEEGDIRFTNQDLTTPNYTNNNLYTENSVSSSKHTASYLGLKSFPRIKPYHDSKREEALEKKVSNALSKNKISKGGEEISLNSNIINNYDDEKEVNLSQFTDNKSLLVDKFSAFNVNQRQKVANTQPYQFTKVTCKDDEKILNYILLIQRTFRDYLVRKSNKTERPLKDQKNIFINFKGKDILNKSNESRKNILRHKKNIIDKKDNSSMHFITKHIEINNSNEKIELIQRAVRQFLTRKNFYGKTFNRMKIVLAFLLKNKIYFNSKYFVFQFLKKNFYVPEAEKSTDTIKDDYSLTKERFNKVCKVYTKVTDEICLSQRIQLYEKYNRTSNSSSELSNKDMIIENDNEVYK